MQTIAARLATQSPLRAAMSDIIKISLYDNLNLGALELVRLVGEICFALFILALLLVDAFGKANIDRIRPREALALVGNGQRPRKNRIQMSRFLNRYCALDSLLEPILLTFGTLNV